MQTLDASRAVLPDGSAAGSRVAVLLATYNGEQFIEEQIRSLRENTAAFTVHWIDDHSTDDTRAAVYRATQKYGVAVKEWHQADRLGYPGTFFHLLECVEADFYLFCDQDDIWQPGKIDAAVSYLATKALVPALCFSDAFVFNDDEPLARRRLSDVLGVKPDRLIQPPRCFTFVAAVGNTIGINGPLRAIYLRHHRIAKSYSFAHDWWIYTIALCCGTVHVLADAPTTLWRQHSRNFSGAFFRRDRNRVGAFPLEWKLQPLLRRLYSRQAEGFLRAAETLPRGPMLDTLLTSAKLAATLDKRQSPTNLARLIRYHVLTPRLHAAFRLVVCCSFFDVGTLVNGDWVGRAEPQ